ncbi:MAG: hypothetical protein QOH12_3924, partial [Solirubrobacteraceae bacterium]|nr:hypothetical protein [Solirubrobacteraceae bacterium]
RAMQQQRVSRARRPRLVPVEHSGDRLAAQRDVAAAAAFAVAHPHLVGVPAASAKIKSKARKGPYRPLRFRRKLVATRCRGAVLNGDLGAVR